MAQLNAREAKSSVKSQETVANKPLHPNENHGGRSNKENVATNLNLIATQPISLAKGTHSRKASQRMSTKAASKSASTCSTKQSANAAVASKASAASSPSASTSSGSTVARSASNSAKRPDRVHTESELEADLGITASATSSSTRSSSSRKNHGTFDIKSNPSAGALNVIASKTTKKQQEIHHQQMVKDGKLKELREQKQQQQEQTERQKQAYRRKSNIDRGDGHAGQTTNAAGNTATGSKQKQKRKREDGKDGKSKRVAWSEQCRACSDYCMPFIDPIFEEKYLDPRHDVTHRFGGYKIDEHGIYAGMDIASDMDAATRPSQYHTDSMDYAMKYDDAIYYNAGTGFEAFEHELPCDVEARYATAKDNITQVGHLMEHYAAKNHKPQFNQVKTFVHNCYRDAPYRGEDEKHLAYDTHVLGRVHGAGQLPVGVLVTGIDPSDNDLLLQQQMGVLQSTPITTGNHSPSSHIAPVVVRLSSEMFAKGAYYGLSQALLMLMSAYNPRASRAALTRTASRAQEMEHERGTSVTRSASSVTISSASFNSSAKDIRNQYALLDAWYERCQAVARDKMNEKTKQNSQHASSSPITMTGAISAPLSDDDTGDVEESINETACEQDSLEPKLVFIIDDTERLKIATLNQLLRLFMHEPHLRSKPFVLLLAVSMTPAVLHPMLETAVAAKLWLRHFMYGSNQNCMLQLTRQLFERHRFRLLLSPSVLHFIHTYFYNHQSSLACLTRIMTTVIQEHYGRRSGSQIVMLEGDDDGLEDVVTESLLEICKELPSVAAATTKSRSAAATITKAQVIDWLKNLINYRKYYTVALGVLRDAVDECKGRDELEGYKLLQVLASSGKDERNELWPVFKSLESLNAGRLVNMMDAWLDIMKRRKEMNSEEYFAHDIAQLDLFRNEARKSENSMLKAEDLDSLAEGGSKSSSTISATLLAPPKSASKRAGQVKALAEQSIAIQQRHGINASQWLRDFVEKHLPAPTSFTLHELVYYHDHGTLQSRFLSEPRNIIMNSFTDSSPYFKRDVESIDLEDMSLSRDLPHDVIEVTDRLEDIQIMWALYREQGHLINLQSWFDAFQSVTSKLHNRNSTIQESVQEQPSKANERRSSRRVTTDSASIKAQTKANASASTVMEMSEEDRKRQVQEIQTRFMECLSIMKELGFVKASRKVDHVSKTGN